MTSRDELLLTAIRARVMTSASLPATRAWLNTAPQPAQPTGSDAWCADYVILCDTRGVALGPNPRSRTELLYQLSLRVPKGSSAFALLGMLSDVKDALRGGGLLAVGADPVTLLDLRTAFPPDPTWLHGALTISLHYDHA